MDIKSKESTILRIHHGKIGHSDHDKTTLYGYTTLHDLIQQADKLTDSLSDEVHRLVNEFINQYGSEAYFKWNKRYETGFQIGLGIGFECGKI